MTQNFPELAMELGVALKKRGWILATAESCTGGGLAYWITSVPGSSAWFEGGYVTYSNRAKNEMLRISSETLRTHGAVSAQTACLMAEAALFKHTNISIAITGIAGPEGGSKEKPVGMVWFAIASHHFETRIWKELFSGDRAGIREQAIEHALRALIKDISK